MPNSRASDESWESHEQQASTCRADLRGGRRAGRRRAAAAATTTRRGDDHARRRPPRPPTSSADQGLPARAHRAPGDRHRDAAAPTPRRTTTLAEARTSTTRKLLEDKRAEVAASVKELQDDFAEANPAYEEMEGVVAGVPSLADYDVIIDAGGDASDPESAVPFIIKTPAGKDVQAAGQLQLADRDLRLRDRAEVRGQGRQARPRRRRQGRVRRGAARRRLPASPRRATSDETPRSSTPPREGVEADARRTRSPRSS